MTSPREQHFDGIEQAIGQLVKASARLQMFRAAVMAAQGAVAQACGDSTNHAALEAKADLADIDRLIEDIHARLVNAEDGLEHYKQAI